MNGKGDKARPFNVSRDEYEDRFDAIFRKKEVVHHLGMEEVETTVDNDETLYQSDPHPFAEWLKKCPVEFSEDYTDNHGTRAGYTFWIE
jgi:hypothetical protein